MNGEFSRRWGRLNPEQRVAAESIVQGWDSPTGEFILPIVEGPPGTGKTEVGVLSAFRHRMDNTRPQIAYLCYTHFAADRVLEALIGLEVSPDDVLRVVPLQRGSAYRNHSLSNYYMAYNRVNQLLPDQRRHLREVPILITTLQSSGRIFKDLQTRPLILIDEFSQVPPSLFFSTLSKVRRAATNPPGYALLGDPNQLPVITSQPFLRLNVGSFISARRDYEPHELTVQYRMHSHICQAVNALRTALCTYPLETHPSVRERTLIRKGYSWDRTACPGELREVLDPDNPCVIINTDNLQGYEDVSLGGSKYFSSEARLASRLAEALHDSYASNDEGHLSPMMLSPYSAQTGVIKNFLPPNLQDRCITVYKAQGREYPSVIVSFARKNPEGWIGFLGEPQLRAQTYVACSRAESKLIVLFSFSTFRGHRDYDLLLERTSNALIVDAEPSWSGER